MKKITSVNELISQKYGAPNTKERANFSTASLLMHFNEEMNEIPAENISARQDKAMEIFGLIKEIREQAGLTQENIAEKTGLKASYISRVENKKADIQFSSLLKILAGLNIDIQFSFRETETT
ncbi:putative transcriptional regulator with C-terminal CBS domains [Saprospira grandis DSM 2844]|uniref:Putative transcriptional regulator with C-terminal CBS domains n=1 Tax=Saprospira grandis DSM 2844 TaxID=694433 RepID=J0P5Q6_9BACT|nr:helix-turn-helix transcriptional regulator [Saprospira grandis]EJF55204.1 putative transcriptional regulator with C-terminal CBS domains [Saprospira grandis DSM 2844]